MNKLWIHFSQRLAWSFSLAWVIFSCTKVSPTNSYLFITSVPGLWRSRQWFPLLVCLCPPLKTHLLLLSDSYGNFTHVFLLRPHVSKWREYDHSCLISQVLPITPSWPCWTLSTTSSAASPSPSARRPSLFSPLRLRSPGWRRSWWPSLCHSHLLSIPPRSSVFWCWLSALLLRRRSSPRNLLLWQLSQRCRRKSLRVSRSPKTISKTRKRWRVTLKAWRTQVEEATSLEKVLSSFKRNTCLSPFWQVNVRDFTQHVYSESLLKCRCPHTNLIRWPHSGMSYYNVHTCVHRAKCPVMTPIWSQVSLSFPVINWQKVDGRRGITKANSNLRALCGPF